MINKLPKLFAAAGLSLALAFTGVVATSSQAQADNDNLHRFLGGAAALIILGSIINNQRGNHTYAPTNRGVFVQPYAPQVYVPQLVAPSRCYSRFNGPHGTLRGFGAHCMQSSTYVAQLPSSCLERIFTYQGWRQVYDAQCLYRHGWVRS